MPTTRRALKRVGSSSTAEPATTTKKMKYPIDDPAFVTPYSSPKPSPKLPSSVGPYESPKDFSPVPVARTSSQSLKENTYSWKKGPLKTYKSKNRSTAQTIREKPKPIESPGEHPAIPAAGLSSPFSSRPNSPQPQIQPEMPSVKPKRNLRELMKRTLSDKTIHPNLPSAESPTTSPPRLTFEHASLLSRRPSVPNLHSTAVEPRHTSLAVGSLLDYAAEPVFSLPHPHSPVDFNRPPSSLSCYDYNCNTTYDSTLDFSPQDNTNTHISSPQGFSTPARGVASLDSFATTVDPSIPSPETGDDAHPSRRPLYTTPPKFSEGGDRTFVRSPWIDDSIISPPKSEDWRKRPLPPKDERPLAADGPPASNDGDPKTMFDDLMLSSSDQKKADLPRTRSLGSTSPNRPITGRQRRGTIKASDIVSSRSSADVLPLTRRSRSGTITTSSSSFSAEFVAPLAPAAPILSARRARSGTVIAPPANAVDTKPITSNIGTGKRSRSGSIAKIGPALLPPNRARSGTMIKLPPTLPESGKELEFHGTNPETTNSHGATDSVTAVSETPASVSAASPTKDPFDLFQSAPQPARPNIKKSLKKDILAKSIVRAKFAAATPDNDSDDEILLKDGDSATQYGAQRPR